MASERYSFSLTTFRFLIYSRLITLLLCIDITVYTNNFVLLDSPSGKLVQIEYALAAVAAGAASVGIKGAYYFTFMKFICCSITLFTNSCKWSCGGH